jgi:undecaprenyl-diphosphatase
MKDKFRVFLSKNKELIVVNILGFYLFAKMVEDVIEKEYIMVIDRWISIHINTTHTPLINTLMIFLTNFSGAIGIFVFSVLILCILLYKKLYQDMLLYVYSVAGANVVFVTIKMIVQRLRPDCNLIFVSGYSFPSGHATMATAMAVAVYIIFSKRVNKPVMRVFLFTACLIWIVMIAFSRIYLDVHWLSDVLAGIGLGLFWVTFVVLIQRFMSI